MSSLRERLVGGLQWAITASYVFLLGLLLVVWNLRATGTTAAMDLTWWFVGFVVLAFVAGYRWVGTRPRSPAIHARRIETVVTLLVLGFVFPFAVPRLLDLLGATPRSLPLVGFGVGYALALAVSYLLVYGLDARFFLGHGLQD